MCQRTSLPEEEDGGFDYQGAQATLKSSQHRLWLHLLLSHLSYSLPYTEELHPQVTAILTSHHSSRLTNVHTHMHAHTHAHATHTQPTIAHGTQTPTQPTYFLLFLSMIFVLSKQSPYYSGNQTVSPPLCLKLFPSISPKTKKMGLFLISIHFNL